MSAIYIFSDNGDLLCPQCMDWIDECDLLSEGKCERCKTLHKTHQCPQTIKRAEEMKCSPEMVELIDTMQAEIEYLKHKVRKLSGAGVDMIEKATHAIPTRTAQGGAG